MRISIKNQEEADRLSKHFEESHIERNGDNVHLVIDEVGRGPAVQYKCLGTGCNKTIDKTIREAHMMLEHPNFYNLLMESQKKGKTKKPINLDIYFEEVRSKRQRA
jgi:uncharacterized protein YcgI (DUF1989 family)